MQLRHVLCFMPSLHLACICTIGHHHEEYYAVIKEVLQQMLDVVKSYLLCSIVVSDLSCPCR